jgi:type VI secretion system protein ImpG
MRDDLLHYYERELTYLRRLGAEFGKRYPSVASALQLEQTKSDDPHVERLLEGFAFLTARVHLKLDDEFPEITEGLLNLVYPEYLQPIPSMSLVQFELDPEQGKLTTGFRIPRDTILYTRPVNGVACRFRTSYDTTLWPVELKQAAWVAPALLNPPVRGTDAVAALRIELQAAPDLDFSKLGMDSLRFFLHAESNVAPELYELLCRNCVQVLVRDRSRSGAKDPIVLPRTALRPLGFEPDEGVLPMPRRSFVGYRLLNEYFTFPEKFYFFEVSGLERLRAAGFGDSVELVFLISRFERAQRQRVLEGAVSADTIRLGCTPVINIFPRTSEPILLTQRRHEDQIVPDTRRREAIGVYSVEDVVAVTPGRSDPVRFEPLYGYRHTLNGNGNKHFWSAARRPRGLGDGFDVFLSFVDPDANIVHPEHDAVTARLMCHNAGLPHQLPLNHPEGDFEMPGGGPIRRISALIQPTDIVQPLIGKPLLWRFLSLLSLNFVSLVEGGPEALQELLRLHNRRDSAAAEKQIQAIMSLSASPTYARIRSDHGLTFARGQRIDLELDEEQFVGGGVYLFSSVLDRFLGLYTTLNSFNVLRVRTRQRKEMLNEWPPRAGWKALV